MAATLQIRTPEGIVFSQTLASPVTRFLAWAIDLTCIAAAMMVLQVVMAFVQLVSQDFATALSVFVYFILTIGYAIATEYWWRGQTIGKRVLRLRVVDAEGMRLEFSQVAIRNLLRVVDSLPLFYLVGGATAFLSRKAQRLGDIAANTVVIRIPRIAQPDLDKLLPDKFNSLRAYPHLCARLRQRVSPDEASIALQAIMRRDDFDDASRVQLFGELAVHFKAKVEFPAEATDGIADERYVRNVADVLYRSDMKPAKVAAA